MPLRDRLRDLIAEVGEIDDPASITGTADLFTELGLDSMQALEVVLEMERRFSISVSEDKLGAIRSLDDAVHLAEQLGAKEP